MTSSLAQHLLIFRAELNDEFVDKRTAAIDEIAGRVATITAANELLDLATLIVLVFEGRTPDSKFLTEAAQSITTASSSFGLKDENRLEVYAHLILGVLKALQSAKADGKRNNMMAALACALAQGLSFAGDPPDSKWVQLRDELWKVADAFASRNAELARNRQPTPSSARAEGGETGVAALRTQVRVLRENTDLDREEINLLWCAMVDRSQFIKGRRSAATPVISAMVNAMDLASLLVRPCAPAHRELACFHLPSGEHHPALEDFEVARTELGASLATMLGTTAALVRQHPRVFPLAWVILHEGATDAASITAAGLKNDRRFSLQEWTERALSELSLAGSLVARKG